jgi:hypothetical protein
MLVSVSVEAAKLVSLVPIVGRADVCIIGYDEVILSHLVLHLRNYGTGILLGDLGQLSSFQKIFIILLL